MIVIRTCNEDAMPGIVIQARSGLSQPYRNFKEGNYFSCANNFWPGTASVVSHEIRLYKLQIFNLDRVQRPDFVIYLSLHFQSWHKVISFFYCSRTERCHLKTWIVSPLSLIHIYAMQLFCNIFCSKVLSHTRWHVLSFRVGSMVTLKTVCALKLVHTILT